ncbi:MAG: hypothetical protein LBT70_00025 [Holosporaceae bacterium]|nr:hypothetical protein [Holosporaceae bacterium]
MFWDENDYTLRMAFSLVSNEAEIAQIAYAADQEFESRWEKLKNENIGINENDWKYIESVLNIKTKHFPDCFWESYETVQTIINAAEKCIKCGSADSEKSQNLQMLQILRDCNDLRRLQSLFSTDFLDVYCREAKKILEVYAKACDTALKHGFVRHSNFEILGNFFRDAAAYMSPEAPDGDFEKLDRKYDVFRRITAVLKKIKKHYRKLK